MADLPILFSAPMVLALLAGNKTETRRLMVPQPEPRDFFRGLKAKYKVGDRLYVREEIQEWHLHNTHGRGYVRFAADAKETFNMWPEHWKRDNARPMHMLKSFSRITLIMTEAYVQRLQEISDDEAIAEGVDQDGSVAGQDVDIDGEWWPGGPRNQYRRLWDRLNSHRIPWDANPWVNVYKFKVHKTNIERIAA